MNNTIMTQNSLNISLNSQKTQGFNIKSSFDWNLTGTPIYIDNTNPNSIYHWSYTAATYDWCSGLGTIDDPYIIENVLIDGLNSGSSITILNSNPFFIIRHCIIYNAGVAGIDLSNTSNGAMILNNCSYNNGYGIQIYGGENNTIINNIINHNDYGIWITDSHYITVSLNLVDNNEYGITFIDCNYGGASENILKSNFGGLYYSGYNGTLSKNTLENHTWFGLALEVAYYTFAQENIISNNYAQYGGIVFSWADNNTALKNLLKNNTYGFYFLGSCIDNIIKENFIENNTLIGFYIEEPGSSNNLIFKNCFIGNELHAQDHGTGNYWDNGSIGNYWDNYIGSDDNNDGIGDTPYNISGLAGSQDNFPLMECPLLLDKTPSDRAIPGYHLFIILIVPILTFLPILKRRKLKLK